MNQCMGGASLKDRERCTAIRVVCVNEVNDTDYTYYSSAWSLQRVGLFRLGISGIASLHYSMVPFDNGKEQECALSVLSCDTVLCVRSSRCLMLGLQMQTAFG